MTDRIENVVLVIVDALRTNRVGAYSGGGLTPNIDTLAEDGEVFEQCYSCINATDSSLTTILTGLYPTRHGILNHGNNITAEEMECVSGTEPLPERLPEEYSTVAFDTLERWHKRGFDKYTNLRPSERRPVIDTLADVVRRLPTPIERRVRKGYEILRKNNQQTESEILAERAEEALEADSSPFFLLLHYWDTHIPYVPPEKHPEVIEERTYEDDRTLKEVLEPIQGSQWSERLQELAGDSSTVAEVQQKYDAGVWEVDRSIGRVVDKLKEEGIYERTAVIITADHGESFTEHGIIFDHHGLYDPTIHVPLIIRAPGFEGREEQFVQHYDLAPTILDMLDIDYSVDEFDGESLFKLDGTRALERDAIYAEEGHTARRRTIRTSTYKYIKRLNDQSMCRYCGISHARDEELYNLEEDPEERQNIVDSHQELSKELDEKLESWIEGRPNPVREPGSYQISEDVEDHLEEMGYL